MIFNKKRIYKVVWAYDSWLAPTTEYVKARDIAQAWNKIRRQHGLPITCISVEEVY
jgi:hypothetical protein